MEKKYQVFISSTYEDLKNERKKIQEVLLSADCIPAGMENFLASNDSQFDVIKRIIDLCDFYILILGFRYGSVNKTTGLSYTEMEYDYAVSKNIPILVFAKNDSNPEVYLKENPENVVKLKKFRKRAMENRLASIWQDSDSLMGSVALSIIKAKDTNCMPGWIRGNEVASSDSLKQINELQNENNKLKTKIIELETELTNYSNTEIGQLEFDSNKLNFKLRKYNGGYLETNMTIKEIFSYVSINMINVSLSDSYIQKLIKKAIGETAYITLIDENIVQVILNQFVALKLMKTNWVENKGLYYALTKKGEKIRNDCNLIKKVN